MPGNVPSKKSKGTGDERGLRGGAMMGVYVPAVVVPETLLRIGKPQEAQPAVFQGSLRQLVTGLGEVRDVYREYRSRSRPWGAKST